MVHASRSTVLTSSIYVQTESSSSSSPCKMTQRNDRVNGLSTSTLIAPPGVDDKFKLEQLHYELLNSQLDLKKVSDQLNCLMMLVKKAWMGDSDAAQHVAKIVGVAPPDVDDQELDPDKMIANYITKPKSKVLNHWALLTIGLLNRDYKQLEWQLEEQQLQHLQQSEQLLDRELFSATPSSLLQRRSSLERIPMRSREEEQRRISLRSSGTSYNQNTSSRPNNAWTKPPIKHLYRTPQKNIELQDGSRSKVNNHTEGSWPQVAYDDPGRYNMFGLFDADSIVNDTQRKRPPSGKMQRMEDRVRARPKSAVVTGSTAKTQRALRNETTTLVTPNTDKRRVKSAGPNPKAPPTAQKKPTPKQRLPPESVVEFTNDVRQMNDLEENFKRNAVELQKRLGIHSAGLVF